MSEAEKKRVDKAKQLRQAYANVFGTDDGKLVLNDLIARYSVLKETFINNDPFATHFNEGQRTVVLNIMNRVSRAKLPDRMMEHSDEQEAQAYDSQGA